MSRYKDEQCRICRREGQKLFLKGSRCYSDKCSVTRRNYAPGEHGQGKKKLSEYGTQLREKQKTKAYYGVGEKQFRKYFEMASSKKGVTGENLLQILESRLDNVVYRAGFKSFGGKPHDLQLSPGFTAIVGPNGSGKSNLLDALRWSLGETSASRIRISRQSDLLFSGSPTYTKANEAEVLLQLRDEDKICSIRRRVTGKDGGTALFVDNVRHTLSGLELVKHQWKLEGTRFAFIGQGEVQEVLSASPSERRQSLESLFGIDIYRKKRMEASDRLATVRDEYEKLRGLYVELLNRREEIKEDVKKALIAKEIADKVEENRRLLYFAQRRKAEEAIEKLNEEIELEIKNGMGAAFWENFWKNISANINQKIVNLSRVRSHSYLSLS